LLVRYRDVFVNLDDKPEVLAPQKMEKSDKETAEEWQARQRWPNYLKTVDLNNRLVRAVELIPRQSSLNVNDMKLHTHAGAFNFALSTLFGFGSQLNVQRQREQFSQFVQQELYSSAFGKGSREFGWTFTPMPGMDRLQSGVRTTYAVVIVPEEASSIVLESNGCYFPRSEYQPAEFSDTKTWGDARTSRGCGRVKAFIVPIPSASIKSSSDFWVRRISYRPVAKNERIVVQISGDNFSAQIGAMVNGVALAPAIGLAQPFMLDDSRSGFLGRTDLRGENVQGTIERVDANKLVLSFEIKDFEGIPTITLVAPGKSLDLNWLEDIAINKDDRATFADQPTQCGTPPADCVPKADWMFGNKPDTPKFRIDALDVFRSPSGQLNALIHGGGFLPRPEMPHLYVNGEPRAFAAVSNDLIQVPDFPAPSSDTIQVTLVYGNATISSDLVANPAFMKVNRVTIVSYGAGNDKKAGVLIVKLDGLGFPARLNSSDPKRIRVTVTSSTDAFVTITNPNEAELVTLTDPATKVEINTIVTRKPPPK